MALQSAPPMLVVAEIAPATMVGDGPSAGRRCAMIRLGGCNLACTWCDVPYSWDGGRFDLGVEMPRRLVRNILDEALTDAPQLVLITGGEPLLQQRSPGWPALLAELSDRRLELELHTNGTLMPGQDAVERVHRFVVSPKLQHSGEPAWTRIEPNALRAWAELARAGRAVFSFVVRDRPDVRTVATLATLHDLPRYAIWISPEGITRSRVLEVTTDVGETAIQHGFSMATRLAVLSSALTEAVRL